MSQVVRKIKCNAVGCLGKPKRTKTLNDKFNSKVCIECLEVVSYTKPAIEIRNDEKAVDDKAKKAFKKKDKKDKSIQTQMELL